MSMPSGFSAARGVGKCPRAAVLTVDCVHLRGAGPRRPNRARRGNAKGEREAGNV
jgi:hypothetical protein